MSTEHNLNKIAALAYLDQEINQDELGRDVEAIMEFVDVLRQVDTGDASPLSHPLDLYQRLRTDAVTESNVKEELAALAPLFEEDGYLVPKIIESGNKSDA